jgi:hypothetical protein
VDPLENAKREFTMVCCIVCAPKEVLAPVHARESTPGDVAARLLAALPEHFGREHVSAVHTLRAIRTIVNEALAVLERDFVALGDLESSPL